MKKTILLKSLLLLCALIVGSNYGWADNYKLYSGAITEGDYLIVYSGGAMNTTISSDRLQYDAVTPADNVISTTNAAIIWHIAPSSTYWTVYNAYANKYAASTGAKNKIQLLSSGTDDQSLWTVSGTETYEFVNKKNTANKVNANLRKNTTYGFACYSTDTGGALSLYKKVVPHNVIFSINGVTTSPVSIDEDADVNFPDVPTTLGGNTFVGWTTSAIVNSQVEAPTPLITASKTTMGSDDVTYYAVFADGTITTGWRKYTASAIPGEGVYALLTTDGHAFNGTISDGHGQSTSSAFSFTDNVATSAPSGTCEITLVAVTGGYKMYNSTNGYLYASKAASGGLAWHNSEDDHWSYTSDNWQYSKSYSGNYANLRSYNNSSFRTYSGNNGSVLVFAKKIDIIDADSYCTTVTVTTPAVSEAGWATYITPYDMEFTDGDAYAVTSTDSKVNLTSVTQVRANVPLLLKGVGAKKANVLNAQPAVISNLLDISNGTSKGGDDDYVLYKDETHPVGFYKWNGGWLSADKVYLPKSAVTGAREFISLDDETTNIQNVVGVKQQTDIIYNIAGQRVANPTKGLYIVNGKKVIIK